VNDAATYEFSATVWRWQGGATAWYFVSLPEEISDEIADRFDRVAAGFGSIRAAVTIGATQWDTSLFPSKEQQTYILPVKASVRRAEEIDDEDTVTVTIRVGDVPPASKRR
jgi:hypothetical protein